MYGPKFGFSLHIDEQTKGGVIQKQCLLYYKPGGKVQVRAPWKQRICEVRFKNQLWIRGSVQPSERILYEEYPNCLVGGIVGLLHWSLVRWLATKRNRNCRRWQIKNHLKSIAESESIQRANGVTGRHYVAMQRGFKRSLGVLDILHEAS